MESVLTKNQTKKFTKEFTNSDGKLCIIVAKVRYDDQCNNGHNSFAITGELFEPYRQQGEPRKTCSDGSIVWLNSCGCIHDDIAKHFPELAPYIKWHLTSSDGPMHYIANTLYWADEHGPNRAWVYYTGQIDPLGVARTKETLLGYLKAEEIAEKGIEGAEGYRIKWDEKTAKVRNLNYARNSAVWPDATDDELLSPCLEQLLRGRHEALMEEFRTAVESLGFVY
jgi:hypothetical protein